MLRPTGRSIDVRSCTMRKIVWTSCVALVAAMSVPTTASAQIPPPPPKRDSARRLPEIGVVYKRRDSTHVDSVGVSPLQKLTLPVTTSITADRVKETVNTVDAEDAVKYLPSVFLRKRNYGDNQA